MRILLSAYACEPGKGSEPGIGWNWALALTELGHEVWVLTRENNRSSIEQILLEEPNSGLHFIYMDLPPCLRWWKKAVWGVYLYYQVWQIVAFFSARRAHHILAFEWVQHITFGSVRQPSFLGFLGVPFIFGPVAGGECPPAALCKNLPFRGKVEEFKRNLANTLIRLDPLMHCTFIQAQRIVLTSEQTRALVPRRYQYKCSVQLAVAVSSQEIPGKIIPREVRSGLKVLFIGRLLYWKGIHLALASFAHLHAMQPSSRFTIVGVGPDASWLKRRANALGLDEAVSWMPWMERHEMFSLYQDHDVFLFPSLHDSGGMVVLEAMAHGMPIVCLDLGGPACIVDDHCGFKIHVDKCDENIVIAQLVDALIQLSQSALLRSTQGSRAWERVKTLTWRDAAENLYATLKDGTS